MISTFFVLSWGAGRLDGVEWQPGDSCDVLMIVSLPSPRLQLRVKDHFNQWRNTRAPTIQREERVLVYREQDHYKIFSTGLILISFPRHFFNCSLWIYRKSDCFIINKPTVFVITDKRKRIEKMCVAKIMVFERNH